MGGSVMPKQYLDDNGNPIPLTTEESEHTRQLKAAQPVSAVVPSPSRIARFLAPANETVNPSAYDPSTLRGYGARVGQVLKGGASSIKGLATTPLPGTKSNPINWNPLTQAEKDWQGVKDWNELRKVNPDYAWGAILGPMLLTHTVSGLLEPAGMTAKLARGAGVDPAYIEPVVADLRTAAKGEELGTIGDFVRVAGRAEKGLNDEYSQALGKHVKDPFNLPDVNGNFPLSQKILELKDRVPSITDADRAERTYIDKAAAEYQKPISLGELDLKRMQANNRLSAYYDKSDVSQYAAESKNAQIAVDKAVADWVRDNVYPKMDQLTGKPPGYFRNLKSRVGNLMNTSSQAKEFAQKIHRESAVERGSTPLERIRPGGAISSRGGVHGYLANLPQLFKANDPEAGANAAIQSGFAMRPGYTMRKVPLSSLVTSRGVRAPVPNPPPEVMSLPISALLGAFEQPQEKRGVAAALQPMQ